MPAKPAPLRDGRTTIGEQRLRAEKPHSITLDASFVPDGTLMLFFAAEVDGDSGQVDVTCRVKYSTGVNLGTFRQRFKPGGNRLYFLGALADLGRHHAGVRADYPTRLVCDVED